MWDDIGRVRRELTQGVGGGGGGRGFFGRV